jgi:hypothetical protein
VSDEQTPLQLAEARREARREVAAKARDEQKAHDLEALEPLEDEHGVHSISVLHVPHTVGLPTLAAVRTPSPPEMKRYQSRIKPHETRHGKPVTPDYAEAASELASVCLVYPDADTYERLCTARPGLAVQLGVAAVKLSTGQAEDEGKG